MTQLSTAVLARIDHVVETDIAVTTAGTIYYELTAKLEQADGDLFAQLDAALCDLVSALTAAAWVDGWHCGQDPARLVFEPTPEPAVFEWMPVPNTEGVCIGLTADDVVNRILTGGVE